VLARQLLHSGCTVSVANHGLEALNYLQTTKFWAANSPEAKLQPLSIVLMDLEMPIMDGLTCVRKIREWETDGSIKGHVPVIAVTANARMEQIENAKGTGMDAVVTKPFAVADLMEIIGVLASEK
jgi:CheY-like chemotaxis protein